VAGDRLGDIIDLSPTLASAASAEDFATNLKSVHDGFLKIIQHVSAFWNRMLYSSFDGTLIFRLAVIAVVIQSTILLICTVVSFCIISRAAYKNKPIKRKMMRVLLILSMIVTILSVMAIFEVARGVFSSVYGCAVMYQLKVTPTLTQPRVLKFLEDDQIVHDVFQNCLFGEDSAHTENFFSFVQTDPLRGALQQFLGFMDGVKMLHEEFDLMRLQFDSTVARSMTQAFRDFKNGKLFDFPDVGPKLQELNEGFECSGVFFVLTEALCDPLPAGKTECVGILEGEFKHPECVPFAPEMEKLFDGLKTYIKDEAQFMEEVLYQIDGNDNPASISAWSTRPSSSSRPSTRR